jgi:Sporulation and spore germination
MIPRHLLISTGILLIAALVMATYVWRIQKRIQSAPPAPHEAESVAPPPTGPTEQAILYVADDQTESIRPEPTRIALPAGRQQRAEALLRALVAIYLDKTSPHPLGAGSEVRNVYLIDPGLAVIDLNEAFADGHRSGVLVEELTVASMVQTLSANIPGILRVKFLVNGAERDTLAGHADLSNFYDISAVNQLAGQMEARQ